MKIYVIGLICALLANVGMAQNVALVLGTERYANFDSVARGTEPVGAVNTLAERGFDVFRATNAATVDVQQRLTGFTESALRAERMVVVLSGRFVTDGSRTWYLTREAVRPGYLRLGRSVISVDNLMQVMSRSAGAAILLLAYDERQDEVFDPWLSEGVGELNIPQGVTVLEGRPRTIARFVTNAIAEPGADVARLLAADRGISGAGFLPRSHIFLPSDRATSGWTQPNVGSLLTGPTAAQRAAWNGAVALDTVAAYENFLRQFPQSQYSADARARIEAILAEPNRQARLVEEALRLSRNQRINIQRDLTTLGFNTRGVDGIFGRGTRNAIVNWQQQNGYPQTGYLTGQQIQQIAATAQRRRAAEEAEAAANERAAQRAESELWARTRNIGTIAAYENYIRQYPDGPNTAQAQRALAELRGDRDGQGERTISPLAPVLNTLTVRVFEAHLQRLGMNPGRVDGRIDDQTRMAIRRFQNERGLRVTGTLDQATVLRLLSEAQ